MRPRSPFRGATRAALFAAAVALAGCGGSGVARQRVVGRAATIYAGVPMRGDRAQAGRDVEDGERMALAEAHGRVGRLRLRYVALDDTDPKTGQWSPAQVEANAREAVRDLSTIAYLGEVDPAASAVSVVILNVKGVMSISPSDTFAGLTRPEGAGAGEPERFYPAGGVTFARVVPDDVLQAAALVRWMRRDDVRRLAIVDDDQLYGRALAEQVQHDARAAGIGVADVDPVQLTAASFDSLVAQLRADRPDGVLLSAADGRDAARVLQAVHAGLGPVPLYVPGGVDTPAFDAGIGPAAPDVRMTNPILPVGRGPAARAFAARFRRRYGRAPGPYAPLGYEAMQLALEAVRRAGRHSRDRTAVARALHGIRRPRSPLGPYAITSQGATTRSTIGLFRLGDDGPVLVGTDG